MTFLAIYLLFPVVLAAHNIDEYSRDTDFVRTYHSRLAEKFKTRGVIRNALIWLMLTATILSVLTYVYPSEALLIVARVGLFALLINGLGHCIVSLKLKAWTPGALSAFLIILPYSTIAILMMRTDLGDSFGSMLRYAAFGAIAAPLVALLFLGVGYGFSLLTTRAP